MQGVYKPGDKTGEIILGNMKNERSRMIRCLENK